MSIEAVIGAYQIGNRELWRLLCDDEYASLDFLPELATLLWEYISPITSELAAAHTFMSGSLDRHELALRHRFVELVATATGYSEASELASALGLDPAGKFLGCTVTGVSPSEDDLRRLQSDVRYACGKICAVRRGPVAIVLTQDTAEETVVGTIRKLWPDCRLGVGAVRQGLSGATESLDDARLCLESTSADATTSRFEQEWFAAIALANRSRLYPLVADLVPVIDAYPYLVEAVEALGMCEFSVSAAARRLHVHANTIAYRLTRWRDLTGIDARSIDGMNRTMLAWTFARSAKRGTTPV